MGPQIVNLQVAPFSQGQLIKERLLVRFCDFRNLFAGPPTFVIWECKYVQHENVSLSQECGGKRCPSILATSARERTLTGIFCKV
jgi:hypothetical protein